MPIRVALIGLSANAATSWAAVAHLPYLVSARGRAKYEIVALCNSSVDSARNAIAHFQLPDTVKAYGSPTDLAADAEVDLVVCSTRVDVHYETIRPSLEAGKNVFVEWPLAQDTEHARDLAKLAEEKGSKSIVGTQGRLAPVADKFRELLKSGRIGKVLSVEARGFGGLNSRDTAPASLSYFFDRKIGGNVFHIIFAHAFDTIQSIVGEFKNLKGDLHLQRPNVNIRGADGTIVETTSSNVPDLIIANATVGESNASVSLRLRQGQPWPGEPAFVIRVNGEKGEARLTVEGGMSIALSYQQPVTLEVHDYASDKVEKVDWTWADWQTELPIAARNIGGLYEAYTEGTGYPTFADALKLHEQLDELLKEFAAKHP